MKASDIAVSLALHVAVIGVAAYWLAPAAAPDDSAEPVPMYFEIVEEAAAEEVARAEAQKVEEAPEMREEGEMPKEPGPPENTVPPLPDPLEALSAFGEAMPQESPDPPAPDLPPPLDLLAAPPADEERAQVLAAPQALGRIVPVYPRSARRRGHEGDVTLEITVAADGSVSDAEVAASSGHEELDRAALQAMCTARFAPATADGMAVEGRVRLTFDFRLR